MRVRATALGYHDGAVYAPGDVFDINFAVVPPNAWFVEVPAGTPPAPKQGQVQTLHNQWNPDGWQPAATKVIRKG